MIEQFLNTALGHIVITIYLITIEIWSVSTSACLFLISLLNCLLSGVCHAIHVIVLRTGCPFFWIL